jgi:ABC-2 type transport system permease protein
MAALTGVIRYEFRMQVRRRLLWITFLLFAPTVFLMSISPWMPSADGLSIAHLVANWSLVVQFFHPIAFGVLLADRLPRDGRTGVQELLDTLPAPLGTRLLGKYLGATLATLTPLLLIYAAGIGYIAISRGELAAVPLGMAAFLVINLPGLLFVAAFSVSCPVVMWVPLYQFLFVGYWFWGNLIPRGLDIPSLSGTLLTPFGQYMANGFFRTELTTIRASTLEAIASMGLLLGLAALALLGAHRTLRWRQEHR